MASIFDTARYILNQTVSMPALKLQKLCYYAQVWTLVWDDEPLFDEDFEAQLSGPVCPVLHDVCKGQSPVKPENMPGKPENLSESQRRNINEVVDHYGKKDARWLSQLVRMEQPWQDACEGFPFGEKCHSIISKESMAMYYAAL